MGFNSPNPSNINNTENVSNTGFVTANELEKTNELEKPEPLNEPIKTDKTDKTDKTERLLEGIKIKANRSPVKGYRLYDVNIDGVKTRAYIRPRKATPRPRDSMLCLPKELGGQHFLMYLIPISEEEFAETRLSFQRGVFDRFVTPKEYKKAAKPTRQFLRVTQASTRDSYTHLLNEEVGSLDLNQLPEMIDIEGKELYEMDRGFEVE